MADAIAAYCAADANAGVTPAAASKPPRASGLAASDDGGASRRQTGAGAGGDAAVAGQEGTAGDGGGHMPRLRSISLPGGLPSAVSHDAERPQQQEQQQQGQQQQEEEQGGAAAAPGPWPPRVGELHLPGASWGIPRDLSLRAPRGAAPDWRAAPALVVDEAGLSCWHKLDTSFGLPKARARGAACVAGAAGSGRARGGQGGGCLVCRGYPILWRPLDFSRTAATLSWQQPFRLDFAVIHTHTHRL
jgi:hypothetical protein